MINGSTITSRSAGLQHSCQPGKPMLWQGGPDQRAFARRALHCRAWPPISA